MKRFRFSLESVKTLRHFRKTQAAGKLSQASRERLRCEASLRQCQEQQTSLEGMLSQAQATPGSVQRILTIQNALVEHRKTLAQAREALQRAQEVEKGARDGVSYAQQQYDIICKLEDRQRQVALKEQEREDELRLQEFVAAQFIQKQRAVR